MFVPPQGYTRYGSGKPPPKGSCGHCGAWLDPDDTVVICQGCILTICPVCAAAPHGTTCPGGGSQAIGVPGGPIPVGSVSAAVDKLKNLKSPFYDKDKYPHKCACGSDCFDPGTFRIYCTNPDCKNFDPALRT